MKNVDISTSNHVSIEYELAPLSNRIISTIIDFIVLAVWLFISVSIAEGLSDHVEDQEIIQVLVFSPALFYSLICEAFFRGQSIGKYALGIKVVRMDGKNPELGESTIRWAFRLVDLWFSAGTVGVLLISSTERAQRVGDLLANTCIINLKPKNTYHIDDILSIKDTSKYEPQFPTVTQFTDDDMLLLKNALDRSKKNPNKHHVALLNMLSDKIKDKLNLQNEELKLSNEKFLRTVLQDYIVLTRS